MRIFCLFLLAALVFASCSSTPEEMILGTWKYDHVDKSSTYHYSDIQSLTDGLNVLYANATITFNADGSCIDPKGMCTYGDDARFRVTNGAAYIEFLCDDGNHSYFNEIVSISDSELLLKTESGIITFIKQ